jgi:hypothetical protein
MRKSGVYLVASPGQIGEKIPVYPSKSAGAKVAWLKKENQTA